ncbi:hypothetical protein [Sphingorhabdus sp.]|jgi:hypothetical protein|uniref:hypothetical protein n=1 Tax=Sphingorhabdus sp. TaxID=1902408 RepID=UPI003D813FCB
MSRLLVAAMALSASVVSAQPLSDDEIAKQIEKARRIIAVDEDGCVKYPATDEIVVCGENPDNKSQRMFTDRGPPDENRIRPGEAVSQLRAACCSPIPKIPPFWTSSFGYVPPPAIPLEEVLKGLPEPDMIVTDGENAPP